MECPWLTIDGSTASLRLRYAVHGLQALLERAPTRIRTEPITVPSGQVGEPPHAIGYAAGAGIGNRAATERGEAGAENHRGIEQVRIADHALAQARHRLVDQRQQHPVGRILRAALLAAGLTGCPSRQV